jgi:hypothetical protein
VKDNGEYAVMYLEKGGSKELFTAPLTYEGAAQTARRLDGEGYEVIATLTAEHAIERQATIGQAGQVIPGSHLVTLLGDIVRRFRQDYPGVQRETALEVVSLLCTLALEGETDLQSALSDEVHAPSPAEAVKWRQDMLLSILNRPVSDG